MARPPGFFSLFFFLGHTNKAAFGGFRLGWCLKKRMKRTSLLGPPVVPFYHFSKVDDKKSCTLILTSRLIKSGLPQSSAHESSPIRPLVGRRGLRRPVFAMAIGRSGITPHKWFGFFRSLCKCQTVCLESRKIDFRPQLADCL